MTEQEVESAPSAVAATPRRRRRSHLHRLTAVGVTACVLAGATYAVERGITSDQCTTVSPVGARALAELGGYVDWLHSNRAKGYIGEVGWPSGPDAKDWNEVASRWFDAADRDGLWVTAWAAGRWWPSSYRLAIYRTSGRDEPPTSGSQAAVVQAHNDNPAVLRGVDLPSGAFSAGRDGPAGYSATRPGGTASPTTTRTPPTTGR